MNWKKCFVSYLKKRCDSLRDRRPLISFLALSTLVIPAMAFSMGKITSKVAPTSHEEVPIVMTGLWPLYTVGSSHVIFVL
jgi:hypothetical protein